MAKLILASGNKGKLREFSEMMAPLGWDVEAQGAYSVPDIEETGLTFVEMPYSKHAIAANIPGLQP